MFSINLERPLVTLAVVAGLLAVAGPASASGTHLRSVVKSDFAAQSDASKWELGEFDAQMPTRGTGAALLPYIGDDLAFGGAADDVFFSGPGNDRTSGGPSELIAAVGVADGGVQKLGEPGQLLLGIDGRNGVPLPARGDDAPEPAFDRYWRADGRVDVRAARDFRDRAAALLAVIDSRRAAGPQDALGDAVALERQTHPGAGDRRVLAMHGEDQDFLFAFVTHQADLGHPQEPCDLDADRAEHLGRSRPFRDERRDPAKCRLLVGERTERVTARLELALGLARCSSALRRSVTSRATP